MTDRELLELAAKSIGLKLRYNCLGGRDANQPWDPLKDDGDALRLAVNLRMDVEPWIHGDSACSRVLCQEFLVDEPHYGDDPERATRRAITRAAAEIGKEMK